MNTSAFNQQQSFHQDVAPILQQFSTKFTSNSVSCNNDGAGLVVMGNDGIRYHCTTNSQQYFNQNTALNKPHQQWHHKADASTMTEVHQDKSAASWQSLAGPPGSTVAEYLSRLPASTLPYTLHHFLKFSTPEVKKDEESHTRKKKRKYKKKPYIPRPPRPKPGEIRLTTALDGSTLYCCPECQMAYPEKSLLEQHLVVHRLERRFVCNICGAGLKRKEHLDRHKQGHNPERPFVCTVCMKAFKRNEHLSRHFIIHSGDKNQACTECGKAFFRKDHLRKHAQSHIAKRLRNELTSQPGVTSMSLMSGNVSVPILSS